MKIALPLSANDTFAAHYGQATKFRVFDLDTASHKVRRSLVVIPQASRPCHWSPLLRAAGVTLFLSDGMGPRARQALQRKHIEVITGVTAAAPESLVGDWMAGHLSRHLQPTDCADSRNEPASVSGHAHGDLPCPQ